MKAGVRTVGVDFLSEFALQEGVLPTPTKDEKLPRNLPGRLGVDSLLIGGPYQATGPGDTPSRERIFVCHPAGAKDEAACAKQIFSTLARRAYRRPVTDADLRPLLSFYETGRKSGTFESGVEMGLRRLLVAPDFLFRVERDPAGVAPGSAYALNDFELASRLSFFLWSSIPDEQLLGLAEQKQASGSGSSRAAGPTHAGRPPIRRAGQEFRRPVAAPAQSCDGEARSGRFPDFDEICGRRFERETELFFESDRARRPQRARSARRRLHVPERAAGAALRNPGVHGSLISGGSV